MAYCYECARPLFSHWVSSLFNMVKCLFPYSTLLERCALPLTILAIHRQRRRKKR